MPSVFLSYSRADLPLIEQLAARLRASSPEILIWRDQEKIYGGQQWPKVLGEAIADQDVFLLAWSKNSAASHFVEFEWCTAIALKKTIVPCLLDETPLAVSLRAFHGYSVQDVAGLTTCLSAAPPADQSRRTPVLGKLHDITALEETAKTACAQAGRRARSSSARLTKPIGRPCQSLQVRRRTKQRDGWMWLHHQLFR